MRSGSCRREREPSAPSCTTAATTRPEAFEVPWPAGAELQVHVSEDDKWFNREGCEQLVSDVPGAELFLYPGSIHLFTDRSWEEYDEASTALVIERTLAFLDRVG